MRYNQRHRCATLPPMPCWTRSPRSSLRGALGAVITAIRAFARPRTAGTVVLLACACAVAHATPTLAATPLAEESLAIFEGQLSGHRVSAVTLHTKAHTFHASLTDGRRVSIAFPPSQQQRLVKDVRARGIAVKVAKVQPPSHKRRYIVGGVVIVVIILAVAGLLLRARERRMREDEEGPRAPARYSTGG